MPVLSLKEIESLCLDALKRAGASDEQAAIVAEEIADAEAEGIRNVGLGYLHLYLKHLRCGKVNPHAQPHIVKTSDATTVVNADFGFCHHAYLIAEQRLIDTAKSQGGCADVDSPILLRRGAGLVCASIGTRGVWCL